MSRVDFDLENTQPLEELWENITTDDPDAADIKNYASRDNFMIWN